MRDVITIDGRDLVARPAKAREFFDLQDKYEKQRDFNRELLSLCIVDAEGKRAFAPDEVEELDLADWDLLEKAVARVNRYQGDEDQKK